MAKDRIDRTEIAGKLVEVVARTAEDTIREIGEMVLNFVSEAEASARVGCRCVRANGGTGNAAQRLSGTTVRYAPRDAESEDSESARGRSLRRSESPASQRGRSASCAAPLTKRCASSVSAVAG
jgi:hypothetical protein